MKYDIGLSESKSKNYFEQLIKSVQNIEISAGNLFHKSRQTINVILNEPTTQVAVDNHCLNQEMPFNSSLSSNISGNHHPKKLIRNS
ncbi:MAG: hypothetical protein EOP48_27665 [Sphingobacteriales bacterium]|nr:MAG: hypothetical protein EOP48_27665 [Sphingobacteriales bacterium]